MEWLVCSEDWELGEAGLVGRGWEPHRVLSRAGPVEGGGNWTMEGGQHLDFGLQEQWEVDSRGH